jgi:alginate O-acetyltransferase complex protein AlgI
VVTFHLVCLAWIFFRSPTVGDAWYVLTHLLGNGGSPRDFLLSRGAIELAIVSGSLALVWTTWWIRERMLSERDFSVAPAWFRWAVYGGLAALLILFTSDSNTGFIYFQF